MSTHRTPSRARRTTAERVVTLYSVLDLPITAHFTMDAEAILRASGADRLGDLSARSVIELEFLSELAETAPEQFYSPDALGWALGQDLRTALERRQLLWLAAVPQAGVATLANLLGTDVVQVVGPATDVVPRYLAQHEGESLVPVAINPTHLLRHLADGSEQQREYLRTVLNRADTLNISTRNRASLDDAEVESIDRPQVLRLLRNPKTWAYLIVLSYSALRALPVMFVPHFHGRLWILWTIDLVTAIPYTWGIITMVTGHTWQRRLTGLVVALITFMAPYVYFWTHGKHYPIEVHIIVATLILGAIGLEVVRWSRDKLIAAAMVRRLP